MLWLLLTLSPPSFLQNRCDVSAIEAESGFCILKHQMSSQTQFWVKQKKSQLYFLVRQGHPTAANALKASVSRLEDRLRSFMAGDDSEALWKFFWLVYCGEVSGSQHHQPSRFQLSGVCLLVGSTLLISPTW